MAELDPDTPISVCSRKKGGQICNTEFPLIKENLKIARPEIPQLAALCPQCGQSKLLDKETSEELAELYFKEEIAQALASPARKDDDPGGLSPEDFAPSGRLAETLEESMTLLGYNEKKWKAKVEMLKKFVKSNPMYQTESGLQFLLNSVGVDPIHIPLLVSQVLNTQRSAMPLPGASFPPGPGAFPFPVSGGGTPSLQGFGVHTTPQGQVIVIPPAAVPPAPTRVDDSDPEEIIEEKLDKNGNVVGRTIRRRGRVVPEESDGTDRLIQAITLLKDLGLVGQPAQARTETSDETRRILETMVELKTKLAALEGGGSSRVIEELEERYETQIEDLQRRLEEERESRRQNELSGLKAQLRAIEDRLANPPNTTSTAGVTDTQAKLNAQTANLRTVTSTMESVGSRILEPLVEMQKAQIQMNSVLMLRNLELQDHVAPGTYLGTIGPQKPPTDTEVQDKLNVLEKRAAAIRETMGGTPEEQL